MKDNLYTQSKESIEKIFSDNWVNEDVENIHDEKMAHSQNQELIRRVMLGVCAALEQYDPMFDTIFSRDWIDFATKD